MQIELTPPYPKSLYLCHAFGYLSPFETMYLMILSRSLPEGAAIINIGAGVGTSGLAFTEAHLPIDNDKWEIPTQAAQVYTIDVREESPEGGLVNEQNAFRNVGWLEHLPKEILMDSKQAGHDWQHGEVDLVFVDGDHSIDGCTGDIVNWIDHIKPGGLMVFHDYGGPYWGDVKDVVDKLMKNWIALPIVDRVAAFRKPVESTSP